MEWLTKEISTMLSFEHPNVTCHFFADTGSKDNISEDVSPNIKGNDISC